MRSRRSAVLVLVAAQLALVAGACDDDGGETGDASVLGDLDEVEIATETMTATFEVNESVEQLQVTGAEPSTDLVLFAEGDAVDQGTTDDQGSFVFRLVEPGDGYVVQEADGERPQTSGELTALSAEESLPAQSFYDDQVLEPGFGYLETRDGTTLSINVVLPGPLEDGPYPTVVEYSGYNPSEPGGSLLDLADEVDLGGIDPTTLCPEVPTICDAPSQPGSVLASVLGYAVVGVNMRGTGCSGGAYDFFETLQVLDGHDVVETVATQDWVAGGKVGMVGLSYPGLSQLWVAAIQPPSLAAITPLSVVADTVRSTLTPGGIYNEGFALTWAEEVLAGAEPFGQGWEQALVDAGDTTCAANQVLRGQNVDAAEKARSTPDYEADVADPLNPWLFVDQIEVPVFLQGSAQDEQTGGQFPILFDRFTNAPVHKFTLVNGVHPDGFAPQVLVEWKAFLDFYVRGEVVPLDPIVRALAPMLFEGIYGTPVELPPERFLGYATVEEARAAFEAEPDYRVIFESGAGSVPGAPVGRFEHRFETWPPEGQVATTWYLQPDGTLGPTAPSSPGDSASEYAYDSADGARHTINGASSDVFAALPAYEWTPPAPGSAAVFETAPLAADMVMVGGASADLWIRSSADDADISVVVTEVRPDGQEMYVSDGVLRASRRGLDEAASTALRPVHSFTAEDRSPLTPDEWEPVRLEVFPFNHIFRAGSRVRVLVETPGGNRPRWTYVLTEFDEPVTIAVAHSADRPSSVVFPVIEGLSGWPADLPPCPSLRGQPCRPWAPFANSPSG